MERRDPLRLESLRLWISKEAGCTDQVWARYRGRINQFDAGRPPHLCSGRREAQAEPSLAISTMLR